VERKTIIVVVYSSNDNPSVDFANNILWLFYHP